MGLRPSGHCGFLVSPPNTFPHLTSTHSPRDVQTARFFSPNPPFSPPRSPQRPRGLSAAITPCAPLRAAPCCRSTPGSPRCPSRCGRETSARGGWACADFLSGSRNNDEEDRALLAAPAVRAKAEAGRQPSRGQGCPAAVGSVRGDRRLHRRPSRHRRSSSVSSTACSTSTPCCTRSQAIPPVPSHRSAPRPVPVLLPFFICLAHPLLVVALGCARACPRRRVSSSCPSSLLLRRRVRRAS